MKRIACRIAVLAAAFSALPLSAASPESEEYRAPALPAVDTAIPGPVRDGAEGPLPEAGALPQAGGARSADTGAVGSGSVSDTGAAPRAPSRPATLPNPGLSPPRDGGPRRALALLPTAAAREARIGDMELETVEEALRLGAAQTGLFRLLSPEETSRPFGRSAAVPRDCFAEECALRAARKLGTDLLLVSRYAPASADREEEPVAASLTLALLDARTGRVVRAVRARACAGSAGPIPFAQQAVWHLLLPASPAASTASSASAASATKDSAARSGPSPAAHAAGAGCDVADLAADSGSWRGIPWLNARDSRDNRLRWAAAGAGVLAAGVWLAWAQGQLYGDDPNSSVPSSPLLSGDGSHSWLRGFFATPNPGARVAALGGAGLARQGDALSVVLNPAAVADADRESAAAARRNLPGDAPSFQFCYAGPIKGGWYQGLAVQHEGDELANETSLHAAVAWDWGSMSPPLAGFQSGAALKGYLAKVGSGGEGLDRSTGHSVGLGLDLGVKLRLSPHVSAAAAVRDAVGFLRHVNTFTNRDYWELLPPEYRLGAAYQVDPTLLLALDGQKGMVADQIDHVRVGAEKYVFRFLALRAGLHQAFGRQAVRKLSAGFGIDSEGLSDRPMRGRVSLSYAYDFGLDEDEPLGTGQAFSLEVSW